jgi:preprotein translocase subunit SecG
LRGGLGIPARGAAKKSFHILEAWPKSFYIGKKKRGSAKYWREDLTIMTIIIVIVVITTTIIITIIIHHHEHQPSSKTSSTTIHPHPSPSTTNIINHESWSLPSATQSCHNHHHHSAAEAPSWSTTSWAHWRWRRFHHS